MKLFLKVIIALVALYLLGVLAFIYEEHYRKLIRYLYEILSQNKISFQQPRKYFHFASGAFIFTFCSAIMLLFFLLKDQLLKFKILHLCIALMIFALVTITYSFLDSTGKVAQCTACQDGTRILTYDEILYDFIFIISATAALIPAIVLKLKR